MGSIYERYLNFKRRFMAREGELCIVAFIVLLWFFCYAALRLIQIDLEKVPVRIERLEETRGEGPTSRQVGIGQALNRAGQAGMVLGSSNGSVYHYPWCSGALRIKEENKIWFASIADAESKGYKPASNCPGL